MHSRIHVPFNFFKSPECHHIVRNAATAEEIRTMTEDVRIRLLKALKVPKYTITKIAFDIYNFRDFTCHAVGQQDRRYPGLNLVQFFKV